MSNYKEYFAIESKLKKQGFEIERSDVILQFSNGRKQGLSQLTHFEYSELLRWLNQRFGGSVGGYSCGTMHCATTKPPINEFEDRQKKKIIALFCKMGYLKDTKPDMYRINGWAMSHGHLHKKLNDYHGSDLTKLVTQADEMYKTYIERL